MVRNLEIPQGNTTNAFIPCTALLTLQQIAETVGVKLGDNQAEILDTVEAINKLEEARTNVFHASNRKNGQVEMGKNGKDDMTTPDHIQDLSSEDEDMDDEDAELDDCIRGLASIMSKRNPVRKSWGRGFNMGRGRGRGRHIYNGIRLF